MKTTKGAKGFKSLALTTFSAALVLGALAGCGSNSNKEENAVQGADGTASPAGPYKMSMMLTSYNPEPMDPEGEIYKQLEERTNTDLKITWVPSTTYSDKLSATIASGELPSTVLVLDQKLPYIVNSVRSGMFWELGPYLKDYPNLSRMNEVALNAISIDGKVYGIYRERDLARDGLMLRKDWLENLGLQEPKTVDDFYKVLQAFVKEDPDQNGKADTIGLAEQQVAAGWRAMLTWMGGPADWGSRTGRRVRLICPLPFWKR